MRHSWAIPTWAFEKVNGPFCTQRRISIILPVTLSRND